jgi:hypothetical protein
MGVARKTSQGKKGIDDFASSSILSSHHHHTQAPVNG